ncbi:uncharacterized protein LOC128214551 [Mya arenaria]|uniref:uncharacterized protein LOC128214551 n=1 Tax=Mya arenaria TaxID=6604 RepID=UPI0022E82552|nr:uncharacterized protein LOC128214551 [Mya arenaria]
MYEYTSFHASSNHRPASFANAYGAGLLNCRRCHCPSSGCSTVTSKNKGVRFKQNNPGRSPGLTVKVLNEVVTIRLNVVEKDVWPGDILMFCFTDVVANTYQAFTTTTTTNNILIMQKI